MFKKVARLILLTLAAVVILLLVIVAITVARVDRTPADELASYDTMMSELGELSIDIAKPSHGFTVGFAKANITPSHPVSLAGYGKRRGKPYKTVHDSIFVRAVVISNGSEKVAIVSADLLIMPPKVTELLEVRLPEIGYSLDNTYLTATHSHNSIGHWGVGATRFIYGEYEESVVQFIADRIVETIASANGDLVPATIRTGAVALPGAVKNRLIEDGPEDPWLRVIEIQRSDGSNAALLSYPAHATCLSTGTLELSRDYPGVVVDKLETGGYSFAMFLAGAVGSHKGTAPENDWGCMEWMADQLTGAFLSTRDQLRTINDSAMAMTRVPLRLGEPQVKISEDWKLRSWVFRSAFGESEAFLTALRIGDLILLGTPCDYSGELTATLDATAQRIGVDAMVTSFNGAYIGYVTPGRYFDVDHYETRLMNWYAPGTGEYMRKCLDKLMIAVSDSR